MARQLKDWLDAYMTYSFDSEPPASYHAWVGIGTIASVLQRRVYIKWGRSTIYPNLYIILVGPSGRAKKGTAFEFATPIIKAVGVEIVQGAIIREKLIRRMATALKNFTDLSTDRIMTQCALTCFSGELSVFLGQQNVKFLADLCDWYDCPPTWKYDTKNSGTDALTGVCFNLIGATAPDWLPSILPKEAIGGGFTSRVIWIVEEDKGKTVAQPTVDEDLEKILIADLEHMMNISGEFILSEDATKWYVKWYEHDDAKAAKGQYAVPDPQMSGYCDRRATLIKKLGMIMAMSEHTTNIVEKRHLERALEFMKLAEAKMSMNRLFGEMGSARYAIATEKVLAYIYKHRKTTRSQVMSFLYRDLDLHTFNVVIETLAARKMVEYRTVPEQNEVFVDWIGKDLSW